MIAAVSMKSFSFGPKSMIENRSASSATCSAPRPRCKLKSCTPAILAKGSKLASGMDRRRSILWSAFPCQAIPTRSPAIPLNSCHHCSTSLASGNNMALRRHRPGCRSPGFPVMTAAASACRMAIADFFAEYRQCILH